MKHSAAVPVAIVGMSAIFPGEPGLDGFWRTVQTGRDAIGEVPPTHWSIADYYDPDPAAADKTYCRRGGFIAPVAFDPLAFGVPPSALQSTDSAQLLALVAAKQALEQARAHSSVDPDRISVVLGVASTTELVVQMGARLQRPAWLRALHDAGIDDATAADVCDRIAAHYPPWVESTFPGLLGNVVAGRIANRLDLGGANFVTDAACASSLSALQVALHQLYLGECDMALSGGVDALNDIMMFMCFSKTPAFSPTGDCRPFSDAADGTIIGEGVGMLALKRLADAERDGDSVFAVIRGLGSSSDGKAQSVYAPRPQGQAKALTRAYERAGYSPATVELVEAHGTATKAGDAAEFEGLTSVFVPHAGERAQWCALGSVKSQIGHTKAAAGAAGLIKATLALAHRTLPATAKVERPNPALEIDRSPFYLNTAPRPWVRGPDHLRRASVSSFGFGGSNFHVTLEEYVGEHAPKRIRCLPSELVLLSADGATRLAQAARELAQAGAALARVAHRAAQSFSAHAPARAAVIAASDEELAALLGKLADALETGEIEALRDPNIIVGLDAPKAGKLAFLFPGQGSQYVGMGADLAMAFPAALAVWDGAAGQDRLHEIVFPPPAFDAETRKAQEARLVAMTAAQPALAATSLAQLRLLRAMGVSPDAVAGHSFGELTALAAAGVFDERDVIAISRTRAALMTEAAGAQQGAMLAVATGAEEVRAMMARDSALAAVTIANDNARTQCVLAGPDAGIARAEATMRAAGIAAMRLKVASAFHSPLMAASCAPFRAHVARAKLQAARCTVYANTTAAPYGDADVAQMLSEQLSSSVRFREMIEAMAADGITRFIEVGPGRILSGLVDQIVGAGPAIALDDRKSGDLRGWWRGLGRLACDGVALDLAALFAAYEPPRERERAPAHTVAIGGANYGKPRPSAEPAALKVGAPVLRAAPTAPIVEPATSVAPPALAPLALSQRTTLTEDAWSMVDRLQAETAAQHRHYLDTMAEAHRAFLAMSSDAIAQLAGAPAVVSPSLDRRAPDSAPVLRSAQRPAPAREEEAPAAPVQCAPPARDAQADVLAIIAEKTGYPIDMLSLDMAMEADLGIDSIKQVEVLSALQDRWPDAPPIEPAEAATLRTLRDIAGKLQSVGAATLAQTSVVADAPTPSCVQPEDVAQTVIAIVADKTGYPADMLSLDLALEADLGIDSIKQVEILSALQERWPNAPEIDPSELARLKTLRDVAAALGAAPAGPARKPKAVAPDAAPAGEQSVCAYGPVLVRSPVAHLAPAGLADGVCVTRDDPALADALVAELQRRGVRAEAVDDIPDTAGAVVSLAGVVGAMDAESAREMHWRAVLAARAVAQRDAPVFVAVQSTGGAFGNAGTPPFWSGGLAGIVKCAAREWKDAGGVKAIDIAAPSAIAIADELIGGGADLEVAIDAMGRRWTVRLAALGGDARASEPLRENAVALVSGGARGVTAYCVAHWARAQKLRLALLGRTPLGARRDDLAGPAAIVVAQLAEEAQHRGRKTDMARLRAEAAHIAAANEAAATLAQLERDGIEAIYLACDVADAASVAGAAAEVRRRFGSIDALVHGAGVVADKRIEALGERDFARVFDTKVAGFDALLQATQDDSLQRIAVFSSVAARFGNPGQAAYAAANEALNKMAAAEQARRGARCIVRSFNWGPWDGGMVDPALKARFAAAGVGTISLDEGATFFAAEMERVRECVEVVVAAGRVAASRRMRLDWTIEAHSIPQLRDHVVKGKIVLPVALVLERLCRAARALAHSADSSIAVRDLQVLSGVTAPKTLPAPLRLTVEFEPQGEEYAVTIRDDAGKARYRAFIAIDARDSGVPMPAPSDLAAWPLSVAEAYRGPLFHGEAFAAIEALEGVSADAGMARLKRARALGWGDEGWAFDPAALDGGLQLALLWAAQHGMPMVLPQRVGALVLHREPDAEAPLRCAFRVARVNEKRLDAAFSFATLDGELVAELRGVEFYAIGARVAAVAA